MERYRSLQGFTIIELMVALVIIGILASLAVNGLSNMTPTMRLNSAANDLRSSLEKAKLTAVQRNTSSLMLFNATNPGGYKVCLDVNDDNTCDASEAIVIESSFEKYVHVRLQSAAFTDGAQISFNGRGLPESSGGGFANGSVTCTNSQGDSRLVRLFRTGRIQIQ